jgi:hypothetical protein
MNSFITMSSPLKSDDIHIETDVSEGLDYLIWFLENHKLTTAAGEDRRKMAIIITKALKKAIRDGIE